MARPRVSGSGVKQPAKCYVTPEEAARLAELGGNVSAGLRKVLDAWFGGTQAATPTAPTPEAPPRPATPRKKQPARKPLCDRCRRLTARKPLCDRCRRLTGGKGPIPACKCWDAWHG